MEKDQSQGPGNLGGDYFQPERRRWAAPLECLCSLSYAREAGACGVEYSGSVGQLGDVGIRPYHKGKGRIQ